jgi:hypothetical protein
MNERGDRFDGGTTSAEQYTAILYIISGGVDGVKSFSVTTKGTPSILQVIATGTAQGTATVCQYAKNHASEFNGTVDQYFTRYLEERDIYESELEVRFT